MKLSKKNIAYLLIAILTGLVFFAFYTNMQLAAENKELYTNVKEYASSTKALNIRVEEMKTTLEQLTNENIEKDQEISVLYGNLIETQKDLRNEEAKIGLLTDQVTSITGVVGTMEKLANTDEELLQKYSKVYFLNEHYIPENLVLIEDEYVFDSNKRYWFHTEAYDHLKQMIISARANGADISVISAYRSFYSQGDLKGSYTITYGQGANTFSADQGYSEHQLGTTVDLTDTTLGAGYESFDDTISYSWMQANAHKFGFVLSYPEDNQYYIFEPWHWRFVGIELATKLRNEGKTFYGVDQRELDKYLISIFDSP